MDLQQRQMKWATRLEEVLADFDALQVLHIAQPIANVQWHFLFQLFQSWMGVDDDSSEHPLRLHFAIVAYREMLARNDPRAPQLAREIYNKFLRPKSGLCAFIEPNIRERVAQRLRHTAGTSTAADLFDECIAPLETFLRKQHALFGTFVLFCLFGKCLLNLQFPPMNFSINSTPFCHWMNNLVVPLPIRGHRHAAPENMKRRKGRLH